MGRGCGNVMESMFNKPGRVQFLYTPSVGNKSIAGLVMSITIFFSRVCTQVVNNVVHRGLDENYALLSQKKSNPHFPQPLLSVLLLNKLSKKKANGWKREKL